MEQPAYAQLTVVELRRIAKEHHVKLPAGVNKADIIRRLGDIPSLACENQPIQPPKSLQQASLQQSLLQQPSLQHSKQNREPEAQPWRRYEVQRNAQPATGPMSRADFLPRPARVTGYYNEEYGTSNPAVPEMLAAGMCSDGGGILEMQPDGYAYLRADNCSAGREDVYVSIAQIRRFCMKNGDWVEGKTRPRRESDRYSALMYVERINGAPPEEAAKRRAFDNLTPIHPNRRLTLEDSTGESGDPAIRMLDFIAPIGLGQRTLIVAPPKAGKTVLLKKIAQAIAHNAPDVHLMMLLIDERPEEVTDIRRSVPAEVMHSTFDAPPENHIRVSELVYERAQRLVEQGKDVVVLMDSLTRLSRAYNAAAPQSGRALSGGLAAGVLQKPKRFFGAARNLEEGGSLTIIATVLVETGSRMDEIIFEEFKGTGNAEIQLDRSLSEKRVFPAIDLARSGTRREELLLTGEELEGVRAVRRVLSSSTMADATEQLIGMLVKTRTNREFFARLREWVGLWEKEGYTLAARNGSSRSNSGEKTAYSRKKTR